MLEKHYKKGNKYDQNAAADDFLAAWVRILGLQPWDVSYRMVEGPLSNPNAFASNCYNLRNLESRVEFRIGQTCSSLEDNAAHEMLHLLHARIDALFEHVVERNLAPHEADSVRALYVEEMEQFITKMGTTLGKLRRNEIKE